MLTGFKGANVFKRIAILPFKAANGVIDVSGRSLNHAKFTSSKIVGNTMGAVRWRAGKLKDCLLYTSAWLRASPRDGYGN